MVLPLTDLHNIQIIERCIGTLSIVSNIGVITCIILKKEMHNTINYMQTILSTCDIVLAIIWIIGNSIAATQPVLCTVVGTIWQFFITAMSCWSFLMSVYVFLIVMFSKQVAENSWYFLHAYAWLLATITTATMYISEAVNRKGAVMGDATFECWISAAYPELRVGLLYAHLWFHFAVLVGMYMFIFWKLKSLKDDVGSIGKSGTGGAGGTDGGDVEGGGGVASRKTSRAASLGAASLGGISLGAGSLGGSNYGVTFDAMPTNLPTTIQKKVFEVSRKNSVTTASHQVRRKSSVGTGAGIGRLPKLIIVKKSSNKKLVMKASLIALGFIVCWTPPAAVRILGLTPGSFTPVWLMYMMGVGMPLTGLWNSVSFFVVWFLTRNRSIAPVRPSTS